jgi:putative membrane protein
VPAALLFAPDDAAVLTVLPATKLLLRGHGALALRLQAAGMLGALLGLLALAPVFDVFLRPLRAILQPHMHWIVWAIVLFMVLGEWPRADDANPSPLRRLVSAWVYLGAGLATFMLSGGLGLILAQRAILAPEAAHQSLLPAFTGLFTIPGMLQTLLLGRTLPPQRTPEETPTAAALLRGSLIGLAGGLFAGFLPVISGGVGALLAGHASAQRDDRVFLIAQGANRVAYVIGGALLLFTPGLTLSRGGLSALLSTHYTPAGWPDFYRALAVIALSGAAATGLLWRGAPQLARAAARLPGRATAAMNALLALTLVWGFTGVPGLGICAAASAIGLIPVVFGGRRLNCLGVLLMPISVNLAGLGECVAKFIR